MPTKKCNLSKFGVREKEEIFYQFPFDIDSFVVDSEQVFDFFLDFRRFDVILSKNFPETTLPTILQRIGDTVRIEVLLLNLIRILVERGLFLKLKFSIFNFNQIANQFPSNYIDKRTSCAKWVTFNCLKY